MRYARPEHPALAVCSCGFEVRTKTDAELSAEFSAHRKVAVRDYPETMVRTKVGDKHSTHFRLELPGSRPPLPTPADVVTGYEQRLGYDRAPARRLDPRKLGGRLL